MIERRTHCDKCFSEIRYNENKNNSCDCGVWINSKDQGPFFQFMETMLKSYNEKFSGMVISGDLADQGCSVILFKGNYEETMDVIDYIEANCEFYRKRNRS